MTNKNIFFLEGESPILSSRIAPANVTLPPKYLKQNLFPLHILFYGHIDYIVKQIKIINKSRKTINSTFLPG